MTRRRVAPVRTYVAFLRAINVGGRAIVKMADLQDAFTAAGCEGVRSYVQSGNVAFEAHDAQASRLFPEIQSIVRELLGGEPLVIFRTARELERLVEADPFRTLVIDPTVKRYVTFLAARPRGRARFPLVSEKEKLDLIGMKNLDVFTVSGRKKNNFYGFPNNFVERELGVAGTTRNWSTITKIVAQIQPRGASM